MGEDPVEEEYDEDSGEDGPDARFETEGATGAQAFTAAWYESQWGYFIPPRFEIPRRFEGGYPVGFDPDSIEQYRIFACAPWVGLGPWRVPNQPGESEQDRDTLFHLCVPHPNIERSERYRGRNHISPPPDRVGSRSRSL